MRIARLGGRGACWGHGPHADRCAVVSYVDASLSWTQLLRISRSVSELLFTRQHERQQRTTTAGGMRVAGFSAGRPYTRPSAGAVTRPVTSLARNSFLLWKLLTSPVSVAAGQYGSRTAWPSPYQSRRGASWWGSYAHPCSLGLRTRCKGRAETLPR
jgi:hypothetical protein